MNLFIGPNLFCNVHELASQPVDALPNFRHVAGARETPKESEITLSSSC